MPYRYFFVFLVLVSFQLRSQNNDTLLLNEASSTSTKTLEQPLAASADSLTIKRDTLVRGQDSLSVKQDSLSTKPGFIVKEEAQAIIDSATIDMYKIFQQGKQTVVVDTTLAIQKEYEANFLRRDYFELLPFVNMASAFNRLGHDFSQTSLQPQMGARSKHFAYFEIEDVKYYRVPTPLTELYFRTTMEQGQLSDATISVNTSPQFNFAIAYRGMRSLGKYLNQRSASVALRLSMTYQSFNERYKAKFHYVSQKHENQENGGITADGIPLFESGDPDFIERSVLQVKLNSAENTLKGKRSFFEHHYAIVHPKDSTGSSWTVGHQFTNESKFYNYQDASSSTYFGENRIGGLVQDDLQWAIFRNNLETKFDNPVVGKLRAGISFSNIKYRFIETEETDLVDNLPLELKANQTFLNADYDFLWRGFNFSAHFNKTLFSERLSDEISLNAKISLANDLYFSGKASFINRSPNFNFIRYKSDYTNYNWHNTDLENEKITSLSATLSHPKLGAFSAWLQRLDNFTYYNQVFPEVPAGEEIPLLPEQLLTEVLQSNPLTYFKVRYTSHYKFWKLSLTTTAQYQKVSNDDAPDSDGIPVINVPEWNVRSTLALTIAMFKKALRVQTGITGQYFTGFYADQYNPLLGDFIRQDQQTIGDYPRIDVFFNGKIRQSLFYFRYEHANASFTGYDYYSAVGYPYRDSILRFGLIWNFFD